MKLPVFNVASTMAPAERIRDLGRLILPRTDQEIVERGTKVELRSCIGKVEIDVGVGGVWASDASRLWRFDPAMQEKKRNLMNGEEAGKYGLQLLKTHALLGEIGGPFRLKPVRTTGAMTAFSPKKGAPRRVIQEDTTVLAEIEVDVSDYGLKQKTLPIVGGGGRFSVVLGEAGRPLAMRGVWRPAVGRPVMHEIIEQSKADDVYRALTARVPVVEFSSELAYYAAPAFSEQTKLYPVYVYSGIADYQGNRVPLRKVMVSATEIESVSQELPRQSRSKKAEPLVRHLPADFQPLPGKPLPAGIALNRRLMQAKGYKLEDLFLMGPAGTPLFIKPDLSPVVLKELGNLLGYYSAGTSWIGLSGGLGGSQNNAKGFVDELAAIGWNIRFNWGDTNAWESDWRKNDDTWVDAVDFMFYTGHANSDGWVLAAPDDTFLHFTETAGSSDLWGAKNLEWAVVAACGPLQDEVIGSGGDVLDRWRGAFDGLHMLMGYGQVTYDNEEEGKRLVQYSKGGSTIMQSWFRAGQEIQPGGIWVGAYYVGGAGGSTGDDHLWGIGSVGPDLSSPTWRACSWVPC